MLSLLLLENGDRKIAVIVAIFCRLLSLTFGKTLFSVRHRLASV